MTGASESWDREYSSGRYVDEPPVAFVEDILVACHENEITSGLYIGGGNGRNYVPLVRQGLDLIGLDVSRVAIEQLSARMPDCQHRLVPGDLSELPSDDRYDLVIGIQVFQHGDRDATHAHIVRAQRRVAFLGLMAARVNAVGTDLEHRSETVEQPTDGGLTIRYIEGPKRGLEIHFFAADELCGLFADEFEPIFPLRREVTERIHPKGGQWSQWEGIWRRIGGNEST